MRQHLAPGVGYFEPTPLWDTKQSAWAQMTLTSINAPIRVGRATVLPGDLVLAKTDGVIFIPAILAEQAIISAEFTNLEDAFNFELNRLGKNGAEFEGGWTPADIYESLT